MFWLVLVSTLLRNSDRTLDITKGQWVLQAKSQIAFNIGGFVGCLAMGYIADRFGRQLVLGAACCVSSAAILAEVFAN